MDVCGSIIQNSQKVGTPKCPPTEEEIDKMWSIHPTEYHSATKRKGILSHTATWMNLEDIMLNEKSQSPRSAYLYEMSRISKSKDIK